MSATFGNSFSLAIVFPAATATTTVIPSISNKHDWRYVVNYSLGKILLIGLASSLGAPILYVAVKLFLSITSAQDFNLSTLAVMSVMFMTALLFSFIATELLAITTFAILHFLKTKKIPIFSLILFYLITIFLIITINYGVQQAAIVTGLALPNAAIAIAFLKFLPAKVQRLF